MTADQLMKKRIQQHIMQLNLLRTHYEKNNDFFNVMQTNTLITMWEVRLDSLNTSL